MKIEIAALKRETQGTGAARRLRRTGRVPGILYGGEQAPVNVELDHKELLMKLRTEAFHASILTLALDGAKHEVLLRSFSMHPYKAQVQHVDFQRVQKDKKIRMKVPLHFVNAEKSPGVKEQGGVVNHVLNELDITCFPGDLPEFIEVDLANLTVGHSVHAKDLSLPMGVSAVLHKDDNPVVATVVVPALVSEEEEAAAADATPAAADVPTTAQGAAEPGAEGAVEGDKAKAGDKGAAKGGDKAAEKPAADKKDKK